MSAGSVGILNVGAGDTKLSFDPSNPAERIRAARIVKDMIRRGYALLIEVGIDADGKKRYERALEFNDKTCEYIIADFDPVEAEKADQEEEEHGNDQSGQGEPAAASPAGAPAAQKRQYRKRAVAAGSSSAIAVAPIAGG